MIRSSQTKVKPNTHSRQYISSATDKDGNLIPTVSANQRLTGSQIIIFWTGALVLLLATFIIGFKAGQKIGAKEVLDQAANQVVRLPIVRPIGRDSETVSLAKLESSTTKSDIKAESGETERVIDFSTQSGGSTRPPNAETKKTKPETTSPTNSTDTTNTKETKKAEESRYEVIYPGKGKFSPPEIKKEEKPAIVEPVIDIKPIAPEPVKPVFNVDALKPSAGWYVQVTAVPTLAEVENLYDKMQAKSISIRIESASIRNRPYYRILFGPFSDRAAALERMAASKSQAGTPGEPFIRQVK